MKRMPIEDAKKKRPLGQLNSLTQQMYIYIYEDCEGIMSYDQQNGKASSQPLRFFTHEACTILNSVPSKNDSQP